MFYGHLERAERTRSGGGVAPSQIVCNPVVGGCTNPGKTDCGVDPCIKEEGFEGDETLVVIHGNDRIDSHFLLFGEQCIRRERSNHASRSRLKFCDGGLNDLDFFPSETTFLSGVRIESTNRDGGMCNPEPLDQRGLR